MHFRGFKKIENLEPYTACKALWLDSNGFSAIENLQCLQQLRCLHISKNLISKIQGLDTLKDLTILDLSNNRLSHIDNLSCCPSLQTINLSMNDLQTPSSLKHLALCFKLQNIDLTNNKLANDESFFDVLCSIPALRALSCNGNELTRLPHFRKRCEEFRRDPVITSYYLPDNGLQSVAYFPTLCLSVAFFIPCLLFCSLSRG